MRSLQLCLFDDGGLVRFHAALDQLENRDTGLDARANNYLVKSFGRTAVTTKKLESEI